VLQFTLQNVSGHALWVSYLKDGQVYSREVLADGVVEFVADTLTNGTTHAISLGYLIQVQGSATVFQRIESGTTIVYHGPYRSTTNYPRGSIIFFNGSTYICNEVSIYDQSPLDHAGWVPFSSNVGSDAHALRTDNPHHVTAAQAGAVPTSAVGSAGGVAPLNSGGVIPLGFLPPLPSPTVLAEGTLVQVRATELRSHLDDRNNPHQVTAVQVGAVPLSQVGIPHGVAPLDASGKVPSSYLTFPPSTSTYYLKTVNTLGERDALALSLPTGSHVHTIATGQTWRYNGTSFTNVSVTSDWVFSVNGKKGPGVTLNTSEIPEAGGFNYFTDARLNASNLFQSVAIQSHLQNTDAGLAEGTADAVTATQIRLHLDSTDNPHQVTAEQIGALSSLASDPSPTLSTTLNAGGFRVTNSATPINATDLATKAYVDAIPSSFTATINGTAVHHGSNVILSVNASTLYGVISEDVTISSLTRVGVLDQLQVAGEVEAGSVKVAGGLSTQFLKADGSLDSTDYLSDGDTIDGGTY